MLLLFVIVLILTVLFYPYLSVVLCRRRALAHLRKTVRRTGSKMRYLRMFPTLSFNRSAKYDLLVEQDNVQYAVKLWSCVYRGSILSVGEKRLVEESRETKIPMTPKAQKKERVLRHRPRVVPVPKRNFQLPKGHEIRSVLLVYPSYGEIRCRRSGGWEKLHSGDTIWDMKMYSPSAFEKLLLQKSSAE